MRYRREHGKADQRGSNEQADVRKAEQQEHLADHRKGEGKMHTGESQRQHEHQEQRREKPHECVQRVPDAQRHPVSHTQNDDSKNRQKPVASGRLLTGILRLQKVHRTAAPRADDSSQSIYHENRHIAYHCSENGLKVQLDAVIDLSVHQTSISLNSLQWKDSVPSQLHALPPFGQGQITGKQPYIKAV